MMIIILLQHLGPFSVNARCHKTQVRDGKVHLGKHHRHHHHYHHVFIIIIIVTIVIFAKTFTVMGCNVRLL